MKKLRISEIAKKFNRSRVAVQFWVEQGMFPNAELNTAGLVPFWEIPEEDVKKFTPPARGRKPKNKILKAA